MIGDNMFNLDDFLNELNTMYQKGPQELESFLCNGVEQARNEGDKGALLVIINELMGLYRVTGKFDECNACANEALGVSKELGIEGTVNYGTVLLNVATAYRVMKRYDEAEELYNQVKVIFDNSFTGADYRMATLYNNVSLLYGETGRFQEAKEQLYKALDMISTLQQSEVEIAITHINIGNLCFSLHEYDEGIANMRTAVDIFEKNGACDDSHYASALSGLGEAYFYCDDFDESIACYEKALGEIERHYGHNDYYNVTLENMELVRDTKQRKEAIANGTMNGMQIAKLYYETYGEPMLKEKYADYYDKITVGLVGEGSECFGFDDEYSTDHDFGPSFCMWLDSDVYDEIGENLSEDYDSLPKTFMGIKARNTIATGKGRVGVLGTRQFYANILGCDLPTSDKEWHAIAQKYLATATNGEIFKAGDGEFLKIRDSIKYYPEHVRVQKLALALGQMSQTGQVNFARMKKRGDLASAQLCINEFVNSAIECIYILNGKYAPYYKWQLRGLDELDVMRDVKAILVDILFSTAQASSVEQKIELVCKMIVCELNKQGFSDSKDSYLENQKNEVLRKYNG
jgi:tetratricopeptide (TPR) repeat protein